MSASPDTSQARVAEPGVASDMKDWPKKASERYNSYLRTSFFFKDPDLRRSFHEALDQEGSLLKGPFKEPSMRFQSGKHAHALAEECFSDCSDLTPALLDELLHAHQEQAVRKVFAEHRNMVVSTGTASGKTECFLYPILFELFRQHQSSELVSPGVRALVLYPMNALANDQRQRLGEICRRLEDSSSGFSPTFGQYIGQTPEDLYDNRRNAQARKADRLPGELVFRNEMRETPPHILLTNYSMLEYLLIRPEDSTLFDGGSGEHWQFIVLDEAHQYRGSRGMEMGMLLRRLKQRLRKGGRKGPFRCIATSATISSGERKDDMDLVARFAEELFGEKFEAGDVVTGKYGPSDGGDTRRYHSFIRCLEGAFLVHNDGEDGIVLNRKNSLAKERTDFPAVPLEIALCKECGQHYYVGQERNGLLEEANRDYSDSRFGVEYYLPASDGVQANMALCRMCGMLANDEEDISCDCDATVPVRKCENDPDRIDQLVRCESCGYTRGGIGDPVQEIVHGSDAPTAVIATTLHEQMPEDRRKLLTFSDSRQNAAFFAWYVEDSYLKIRDRNYLFRAIGTVGEDSEGLSITDLKHRLRKLWRDDGLFRTSDTAETMDRAALAAILREAMAEEARISLGGVGLVRWHMAMPGGTPIPDFLSRPPWNLDDDEAREVVDLVLNDMRKRRAMALPQDDGAPDFREISTHGHRSMARGRAYKKKNIQEWGGKLSGIYDFMRRVLLSGGFDGGEDQLEGRIGDAFETLWYHFHLHPDNDTYFVEAPDDTVRLNPAWLRVRPVSPGSLWGCDTCTNLSPVNVRGVCPRIGCGGTLSQVDDETLKENHYRKLYKVDGLPIGLSAQEHTAQIDSDKARTWQEDFKSGKINILSSSTTFEVGVDLGELDVVFLRNVPPEPFNYIQRVGRAGRRDTPGLAVTYCARNPHDLYHYQDPEQRLIGGKVQPPRMRMTNERIIRRHMVAAALSAFFRKNRTRFKNVESFYVDWDRPKASNDLVRFCRNTKKLGDDLRNTVPEAMHDRMGLSGDGWINQCFGNDSHFRNVQTVCCRDFVELRKHHDELVKKRRSTVVVNKRMNTIARESILMFLSRKAVIPKYGFPVDVVELDAHQAGENASVDLSRDLSLAIAEYAPGAKVVANKFEWRSHGIKVLQEKACKVQKYSYDDARNFERWDARPDDSRKGRLYLIPEFGFTTDFHEKPKRPERREGREYTTRPFFRGFTDGAPQDTRTIKGVRLTKAVPGELVVLCEGKGKSGFRLCQSCGTLVPHGSIQHKDYFRKPCKGHAVEYSLAHELVTDVMRLEFKGIPGQSEINAYSVGYAMMHGTATVLGVPDTDLNVTITGSEKKNGLAIVLYDSVPGGAGLVAELEDEKVFLEALRCAREHVSDKCGCDSSCYGCLRSYRNQFAHNELNRKDAFAALPDPDK